MKVSKLIRNKPIEDTNIKKTILLTFFFIFIFNIKIGKTKENTIIKDSETDLEPVQIRRYKANKAKIRYLIELL